MDELPPIRNLSLTQQRIREALKNAKPLTITKRSDDFFVFEKPKKSDENSLLNRFLKHKTTKNCSDNNNPKKTGYKWSQLKDIMIEELETKRMESQKYKEINEKLENEELDEEVSHELETHLYESVDKNNKKDSESTENDSSSDASDEENDNTEDEEVSHEEGTDDQHISDEEVAAEDLDISEEEESDREANPFVDDEAEDDEEVKYTDEGIERHSDESNDSLVVSNRQKENPLSQRECNEENVTNDNPLDTSFNIFDESFERKAATQKIALSPFITQKPKPRFDSKNDFSELISDFNSNNDEFNSQSLLDLCSGNFEQNNCQIEKLETTENIDSDNEQNDCDSDREDDPILSRTKKVFNIESDNESDNEDNETNKKITKEIKNSLKSFNESDGEELIITDDSLGDEDQREDHIQEEEEEDNTLAEHNVNSFFDNEAELSGSDDVSSDEDDVDDEEPLEEEEVHEDLPSDEQIEEQNMKYFNKQILDEEKRNIMIWKERLFEDGDLHEDGKQRQKKFRWNFETDENYVNDYINDDSDDNYTDSDEDDNTKTPTLKMFDKTEVKETIDSKLENRFKLNLKQNLELKNLNKNTTSDAKSGSISAFVVRDRRLNTIMSFENKRSLKSKNNFKSNKKFKASKEKTKKSIFDLLDPNNS